MSEKRAPVNTTREMQDNPLVFLAETMMLGGSRAIEAQERAGQGSFVASDTLPTEGLDSVRAMFEQAGGSIGEPVSGDPIFTYVTLPAGWTKRETGHSMWSDLVDSDGATRAEIFYKAAFYDRSAFIHPARP